MTRFTFMSAFTLLAGIALATLVVVVGLAYIPTLRLSGREGVWAMVAGCGVTWIASCAGAIPVALALGGRSRDTATPILASTAIRFLTVLLLVAPLALSGWIDRTVFVIGVSMSYLLVLGVDTLLATWMLKRTFGNES